MMWAIAIWIWGLHGQWPGNLGCGHSTCSPCGHTAFTTPFLSSKSIHVVKTSVCLSQYSHWSGLHSWLCCSNLLPFWDSQPVSPWIWTAMLPRLPGTLRMSSCTSKYIVDEDHQSHSVYVLRLHTLLAMPTSMPSTSSSGKTSRYFPVDVVHFRCVCIPYSSHFLRLIHRRSLSTALALTASSCILTTINFGSPTGSETTSNLRTFILKTSSSLWLLSQNTECPCSSTRGSQVHPIDGFHHPYLCHHGYIHLLHVCISVCWLTPTMYFSLTTT